MIYDTLHCLIKCYYIIITNIMNRELYIIHDYRKYIERLLTTVSMTIATRRFHGGSTIYNHGRQHNVC